MKRIAMALAVAAFAAAGCAAMQRFAAPKFEARGFHAAAVSMTEEQCFSCHRDGKGGAPKAPESMYGKKNCGSCHMK